MAIRIFVNTKPLETEATTLAALLEEIGQKTDGIAVALNRRMIPKTEWNNTPLTADGEVMIIKAACGG